MVGCPSEGWRRVTRHAIESVCLVMPRIHLARAGIGLAVTILVWVVATTVLAGRGLTDVYDIETSLALLDSDPFLVVAQPVAGALVGVALVLVVVALRDLLIDMGGASYALRCSTAFGTMSATLMVAAGLVGGFGRYEIRYLGGVHPTDPVDLAYLPLALIANRLFAAAIAVMGLWLLLGNLVVRRRRALPDGASSLGLAAGSLAALGFLLPGGGFSLFGLLLTMSWAGVVGLTSRRGASSTV